VSDGRDAEAVPARIERSGLEILGFVESGTLVDSGRAWRLVAGLDAAVRVPIKGGDLADRVDTAWLEQARANGVIAPDDTFLIDTGYEKPWLKVRWTERTRLAANLVSEARPTPGEAEFVTLAEDGSVMCGVTAEEYEVWVIVDAERLRQPDPSRVPIDPATIDIKGLNPLKIFKHFGPQRLQPPFHDGWVLLGFHATARYHGQIHQLPDGFDDAEARRWSGGREPVHDTPIALDAPRAAALTSAYGLPVDAAKILYYLEYQTSAQKAAQTQRRQAPA
jgi:hypothetical protein